MIQITFGTIVARVVPVYVCVDCGASAQGSTIRYEGEGHSIEELSEFLKTRQPTAHHMPLLWGLFQRGYVCNTCIGRKS